LRFICKLLNTETKEEFYHPSLNFPHGPVATPTKHKSRRNKNGGKKGPSSQPLGLSEQIARARDHIKNSLECVSRLPVTVHAFVLLFSLSVRADILASVEQCTTFSGQFKIYLR